MGICGEHGGDPSSVEFCAEAGLNYVSCSPYRVPLARLAAAQAAQSVDPVKVAAAIDDGTSKGFTGSYGPAVWGGYKSIYGNDHMAVHQGMISSYDNGKVTFQWLPWDGTAPDMTLDPKYAK